MIYWQLIFSCYIYALSSLDRLFQYSNCIAYILLGGYPPFIENNQRELFRKIRHGQYEFHEEYWGSVSKDAKKLISSLLTVDPTKRLSAKQALRNPWITGSDEKLAGYDLGKNLEEFKKFNAKRKFKAAVKGVIAANMMKTFVGGAKATSLERKLTEEDIGDLKETFAMFDKDGGGTISMAELKGVMERLGTKISDKELREIISTVDENNDGEIDLGKTFDVRRGILKMQNVCSMSTWETNAILFYSSILFHRGIHHDDEEDARKEEGAARGLQDIRCRR